MRLNSNISGGGPPEGLFVDMKKSNSRESVSPLRKQSTQKSSSPKKSGRNSKISYMTAPKDGVFAAPNTENRTISKNV